MTHVKNHIIHLSQNEDGSYLVASADSPRFCFRAPSIEEARAKARRALDYFDGAKKTLRVSPRETRVISPLYQREELCVVQMVPQSL